MISKESCIELLKQILAIEKQMESAYKELSFVINQLEYKEFFKQLYTEEVAHQSIINDIISEFQND